MNKGQGPPSSRVTTPRATSSPRTPNSSRITPRTPTTPKYKGIVFSENSDDTQEPSAEDVEEQARRLGVDVVKEPHLLHLVIESLVSQVPPPWKPCFDATKKAWYYYNQDSYKSQWEHPADPIYREKIKKLREDQAMNLMQNVDTRTAKPLKSLPPLKKTGKAMTLEPMPQLRELKKLGPIPKSMTPPMESALNAGLRSLSLNSTAFKSTLQSNDKTNLKPDDETPGSDRKHTTTPRDDSVQKPLNVITSAVKKSGLKLTGAGSAFMKRDLSKSEEEDKELSPTDVKSHIVPNPKSSKENTLVGKPFKSILVNSISSKSQSTNKKWNMDLDSLKDVEQSVWSQIHNENRSSTVKFKLDEDTELHFETSLNENLENGSEGSKETTDQETEEDDEESDDEDEESETDVSQSHVSIKKEGSPSLKNSASSNKSTPKGVTLSASASSSATTLSSKPESSWPEKLAPEKMMEQKAVTVTPKENQVAVEVKQSRSEPIQGKSLEETIMELNREREEAVKRTQAELEKQKSQDIMKAREEIENILKLEMDKIKADFQIKIQTKRAELLHQHNQELSESIEALKNQQHQQVLQMKAEHTAALDKMRAEAEKEFELEKATIREEIRKSFEEEKEELKRKLIQENEFELNNIRFELEQKKGALELELQSSIENLQRDIKHQLDTANTEEAVKKEEENRALEMKDKELQELRVKYDRLESKYNILKKQIHTLVENEKSRTRSADTISKSQSEQMYARQQAEVDRSLVKEGDFVSSDNADSANESDQDAATSSVSLDRQKSSDEDKQEEPQIENEIESRDIRLTSALKSIEDIRQQILALSLENEKAKAQLPPKEIRKQNTKLQKLNRVRNSHTQDTQSNSSKIQPRQTYSEQITQSKDNNSTQLPNKDLVEEAKDFIRSQRHRLSQPSETSFVTPIATTLGVKQRLAMEIRRAQNSESQSPKSKSNNIPPFLHLDHRDISETESSGVGSWRDIQSIQKKKVSEEIDHICQSLSALDGQMKEMWSRVSDGSGKSQIGNFPTPTTVGFNKTEDFTDQKYRQNQPATSVAFPSQFILPERQNLPGTIDQLKQMWAPRDTNNQGDTFGVNNGISYDSHISNFLNPGRTPTYNAIPPTESGLLSTMNPNILQFKHLAFDNTLSNYIPGRGNTALLVESLDEEIKQFKEKQKQLFDEFAPQRDVTADNALHERTKHLREWLDKF